jgi:hypothetical protein
MPNRRKRKQAQPDIDNTEIRLRNRRQPGEAPSTYKIVRIDKKDAIAVIDELFNSRFISIDHGGIKLEAKKRKQLCRKPSFWKNGLG